MLNGEPICTVRASLRRVTDHAVIRGPCTVTSSASLTFMITVLHVVVFMQEFGGSILSADMFVQIALN